MKLLSLSKIACPQKRWIGLNVSAIKTLQPKEQLKFEPSLEEQLLITKITEQNLLIVYSSDNSLTRILSLIILYYLNRSTKQEPSKVLILSKRGLQQKIQLELKKSLERRTTIHNGSILPNARKLDYQRYSVILSTPTITRRDLKEKFFEVNHFSLIIILQAEMSASSSSLRYITSKINGNQNHRILGFTKSRNLERLEQVCKNVQIKNVIQIDELPAPSERSGIQHYSVPLPQEYFFILELLDQLRTHDLKKLRGLGFDVTEKSTFREISAIHETLKEEKNTERLILTGNLQRIMILQRLVVSQGFPAVSNYFNKIESQINGDEIFQGKQAMIEFLGDVKIQSLKEFINLHRNLHHPKLNMLKKLIVQYKSKISIITHNYHNASFLAEFLTHHKFSVIQLDKPISSLKEIELQRKLLPFTEGNTNICITNTVDKAIASHANVIIAYDVNADNIDKLNNIESDIPKVFFLSKQTNEESRFYYLKGLGPYALRPKLNSKKLNARLNKTERKKKLLENSNDSVRNSSKNPETFNHSLIFDKQLYELGIPYLFSTKDYSIDINKRKSFPGFILNQNILFLIIVPSTVEFLISSKVSQIFVEFSKKFDHVFLIFFFSLEFRNEIFENAYLNKIHISLLKNEEEIPKFVNHIQKSSKN
jgi:ERCC4-related helicase